MNTTSRNGVLPGATVLLLAFLSLSFVNASAALANPPADVVVTAFENAPIEWDKTLPDRFERDGLTICDQGQALETTINLPAQPSNQRDAVRIIATVAIEPVIIEEAGKYKPGDPWTRLGNLSIVKNAGTPPAPRHEPPVDSRGDKIAATQHDASNEIEIMRFITGFGGPGTFTQDVTALAPLLQGPTTLRVSISTYKKPAWKVTVTLTYTAADVGYRRPIFAQSLFNKDSVTAEESKLSAIVQIPAGLARPRLRIISTGHATDGTGGDEFVSRTHVLRIDGVEVARWRPWCEDGGAMRSANPMSGRDKIDGRDLWSSDLDRSGWRCGDVVQPLDIPLPELTPGKHSIELEILKIRPKDQFGNYGYWRTSCIAVADEPWPENVSSP